MERFETKDCFVTDRKTGLEWQSKVSGPMSWHEALEYATSLGDGWRLPTVEELFSLVDFSKGNPASSFPGMPSSWFWSSSLSLVSYLAPSAWCVYFYYGYVLPHRIDTDYFYVLCVREGEKDGEV